MVRGKRKASCRSVNQQPATGIHWNVSSMNTPVTESIAQIERLGKLAPVREAGSFAVWGSGAGRRRGSLRRMMREERWVQVEREGAARAGQLLEAKELALVSSEGPGAFEGALPGQVGVLLQGGLVQVRVPARGQPGQLQGVVRGVIREESRASRGRQLKNLLRLDAKAGFYFLCVTYHLTWPDVRGLQRDLEALCKRIERAWPGHSVRWRRDIQRRGAWHFHLLTTAPIQKAELLRMWRGVTGDPTITEVDVEAANTNVRLLRYLTKYLGKEIVAKACASGVAAAEAGGLATASPEGASRPPVPAAIAGEGVVSEEGLEECLTTGAYSSVGGSVGRSWGCRGRAYTPWAEPKEYAVPVGYWFIMLRRLARGSWKASQRGWTEARKANRKAREAWAAMVHRQEGGFSVFVVSTEGWDRAVQWCFDEGQGRAVPAGWGGEGACVCS